MGQPQARSERRLRPRRLTDVHLPRPDRHGSDDAPVRRLRRAALITVVATPATTLLVWTGTILVAGPDRVLAAVGFVSAICWFAFLAPLASRPPKRSAMTDVARARTIRAVRRAIDRNELELHYQPQVNLASGSPYGVEALLRWRRDGELVPPGDFLPAVESSELMMPLTERVLEMALAQASAWHRDGNPMHLAVNLSAACVDDHRIVAQLERLLADTGFPPEMLILEVTETTVLENPEQARAVFDAITALGVSISIDDFGTGYSSLLWLRIFPVAEIKIDRSFVSQMQGDGKAFVEGVIRLANDLSMRVVAEGIEDEPTLRELQALGCEAGQGFLFARGLPAAEAAEWIASNEGAEWARRESTISIDPDYAQIALARDHVAERAIAAGMEEEDVWDVRVAVTEALANAIEHGARADDGLIHLKVAEEQGELRLEISGGGRRAGERSAAPGPNRGRGLAVMDKTMDSLRLTHDEDENLIRLAKALRVTEDPHAPMPADPATRV